MSKKIISLMLAMALSASMVAVAAVSVSADTDSDGYYVPSVWAKTQHSQPHHGGQTRVQRGQAVLRRVHLMPPSPP